ncbi:MAG: protein kinase [Acidobacteriota bacterium]
MDRIGKYEILDKIGSGGFAVVYKGYDPFIKRPVAIKVCFSRDEETRQRFFREAEIAGSLVHRNITTVYDFGMQDTMPYLVEEYLPGEDLAHRIRRGEPQDLGERLDYLMQIASGLEYAHQQGVIHRDIKPSNVRVVENGRLKIMDFGTARLAHVESHLTKAGMTLGTVAYLSPERLLGDAAGLNSDIFSYGVLAYELLSFQRPFAGRNIPELIDQVVNSTPIELSTVWPECPPKLARIVHRCLEKDPRSRYPDCGEVMADLDEVVVEITGKSSAVLNTESPVTRQVPNVQVSGLLERARQLYARGRVERAMVMLDEVLEMDPDNLPAKQLAQACSDLRVEPSQVGVPEVEETAALTQSRVLAWEGPEERRARKIAEAVISVESYIDEGKLVEGIDALRFARRLLGPVEDAPALCRKAARRARDLVAEVAKDAVETGNGLRNAMVTLHRLGQLDPARATILADHLLELVPDDLVGRDLLAKAQRKAARTPPPGGDGRQRKRQEALESIESLLASGQIQMAEDALDFALHLLGDLDEEPSLRRRIALARAAELP